MPIELFLVLLVAVVGPLFVGLYAWSVGKGRKELTKYLSANRLAASSIKFRLFPPAKLVARTRKRDMWFTVTFQDGSVRFARVHISLLSGKSVELFE